MPEPWEDPQEEIRQLLDNVSQRLKKGVLPAKALGGVLAFVFSALLLLTTVYTVGPEEQAVVLRFGRYTSTQGPGPHLRLPLGIDQVVKVPTRRILQENFGFRQAAGQGTQVQPFEEESLMLTGDLNVADVEWIVRYKVSEPREFLFNTRDVRKNLRDIAQSVLRRVVGDRTVSEVLTVGRAEISQEATVLMQQILGGYKTGLTILSVELQNINPPQAVRQAFNEVNEAKQEQEKSINEAEREYNEKIPAARGEAERRIRDAEGYAARVVNESKGDAERFRQTLQAYRTAPAVTRTRLYLETLEEVYSKFSEMTIVDKGVSGLLPVFQHPQGAKP